MTTVGDATKRAIATNDGMLAGRLVDWLRCTIGMNRQGCIAFFKRHAPDPAAFGEPEFEALMELADDVRDPR